MAGVNQEVCSAQDVESTGLSIMLLLNILYINFHNCNFYFKNLMGE